MAGTHVWRLRSAFSCGEKGVPLYEDNNALWLAHDHPQRSFNAISLGIECQHGYHAAMVQALVWPPLPSLLWSQVSGRCWICTEWLADGFPCTPVTYNVLPTRFLRKRSRELLSTVWVLPELMVNARPVCDGWRWGLWKVIRIGWGHKDGALKKRVCALQESQETTLPLSDSQLRAGDSTHVQLGRRPLANPTIYLWSHTSSL